MNLLIIGARGGVGRELVSQGLAEGHSITALVRSPTSTGQEFERLRILKGDAYDLGSVRTAMKGMDAVLSTIGPTFSESRSEVHLYSRGGANIIKAMEQEGVQRGLFITSGGVEEKDPASSWFFRTFIRGFLLRGGYADQIRFERLIGKSSLDWTLVRPTRLVDAHQKPYRVSPRFCPPQGSQIGRADVAEFMLNEVRANQFVHGTPTLAY